MTSENPNACEIIDNSGFLVPQEVSGVTVSLRQSAMRPEQANEGFVRITFHLSWGYAHVFGNQTNITIRLCE